jgi:hypothetical protein
MFFGILLVQAAVGELECHVRKTMTTFIQFQENNNQTPPFLANVTLDGESYSLSCMWNVTGARWYYQLIDQAGDLLINAPLIGSPMKSDIPLAPGLFQTSTLLYRVPSNNFEVTP